jgi:hypothetical protein
MKVFSKIDLLWGYLQLPLDPDSRYLTAFVMHLGVYQFKSLPFGISTGPSAFQKVIKTMLDGCDNCANILDDILVYGVDMADHDRHLRKVLDRLEKYNATVRVDKCVIGADEVEFDGHRISGSGIKPLKSNVDAILRIPTPTNRKELLRFICTAAYYMKFIPDFADMCAPLRQLLKDDVEWSWSDECQSRFEDIKQKLTKAPVLAHFDVGASTLVMCDASSSALGACLAQRQNNVERPVAFASRTLTAAERKYSASEREALACLWAAEHWHFYLYGRKFTLITDHMALKTLLTTGGSGHRPLRLHRWADRLYQFTFDVVYRKGKDHVVPDCLSRSYELPSAVKPEMASSATQQSDDMEDEALIQSIFGAVGQSVVTLEAVAMATASDPTLQQVRQFVIDGWPTTRSGVSSDLRAYFDVQHELSVVGDCIARGCRTVIPPCLQSAILNLAHEGHPGIVKMKSKCREAVWWPGVDANIEQFVRECAACVISGKSVRPISAPLHPVPVPSGPWKKISLDIAGEFVAAPTQHRYVIVAVDYFSKWPEAAACTTVTSSTVIEFLTTIFDRLGLVEEIVTDNGVQFTSAAFEDFLKAHGIRHSVSALYAPQSNAEVERFNRVLKAGLRMAIAEGKPFITGLRQTLATYRTTPHATTGVSPASLMLRFPVRTPLTMLRSTSTSSEEPVTSSRVQKRVKFCQNKMAEYHDQKHHVKSLTVKPGDWVRIRLPDVPHKLAPVYSEPREVLKANDRTVWLTNGQRWNARRCIRHRSSLRQRQKQEVTSSDHRVDERRPQASSAIEHSDSSEPEVLTFSFPPADRIRYNGQNQNLELRRSNRKRTQRDFGPVISHGEAKRQKH